VYAYCLLSSICTDGDDDDDDDDDDSNDIFVNKNENKNGNCLYNENHGGSHLL